MRVERWSEHSTPNATDLRERMEAEGYSVFEWSDPPDRVYGPHAHADDQSHWIVSGALALRVGDQEFVLRPGDRDFLPANTTHSARVVGRERVVYLIGSRPV